MPSGLVGPVPVIVDVAATAVPAVKVTLPPVFETGVAMASVLISAFVELKVQVEIPEEFVAEQAPFTFVDPVLVAVNVGVCPATLFPLISFKVIVIVDVAAPSAMTGPEPVIVEVEAATAPAVNVTFPPVFVTGAVILNALTSATVDCIVQTETPPASDIEQVS